ncbi:hypothetical protein M911_08595 [Ectothiorhodospira haloalkaliphila]|uniref:Uncharacterized protein n=1 Tax=Ectothiorhodospira haloalkaliphila TaxID=421628 RepID=W8KLN9_9GAMM|nr:hypothetical protein M911_08595 [Ectothiorhodospira haloalkaliphila]
MTADEGGFQHRCGETILTILKDHSQMPGDLAPGQLVDGFALQPQASTTRRAQSCQGVQQGALAHPVGAQHAPAFSGPHTQVEGRAVRAAGDVDDQVDQFQQGGCHGHLLLCRR